jgi:hypothetical protein
MPYKDREPHTDDVVLIIEIAKSSPRYGRSTKLAVVDCVEESIDVYRAFSAAGYRHVSRVEATVALQVSPTSIPTIAEIFA